MFTFLSFRRIFDISVPISNTPGEVWPDMEDRALTDYLESVIDDVLSQAVNPPRCPWCDSGGVTLSQRAGPRVNVPRFRCHACRRTFNRLFDTPLAGLRRMETVRAFLPFLSQQLPFLHVSEALELDQVRVAIWVRNFRAWLLKLDGSGYWESKVRLGIRPPEPELTCPSCGRCGQASFRGFGGRPDTVRPRNLRGRKMRCQACGRHFTYYNDEGLTVSMSAAAPTRARRTFSARPNGSTHGG
jgi:transposase-like protein